MSGQAVSGRRGSILREMGLAPLWRLRGHPEAGADLAAGEFPAQEIRTSTRVSDTRGEEVVHRGAGPQRLSAFVPAPLTDGRETIPKSASQGRAQPPHDIADEPVSGESPAAPAAPRAENLSGMDWETLEAEIRRCTSCRLCERRKQAVPGVGDRLADWMLVGEGPGAEEDRLGEPFVGAAGKLLDAMLAAIGLVRGEGVYIANAIKCRPPHNRTPARDEIDACFPFLARQIELVRPKLLLALGRPAAQALLKSEVAIGASRGKVLRYGSTPVVVTYHPAYLLRNPQDKAKVWEDLCFARRLMRESGPA